MWKNTKWVKSWEQDFETLKQVQDLFVFLNFQINLLENYKFYNKNYKKAWNLSTKALYKNENVSL